MEMVQFVEIFPDFNQDLLGTVRFFNKKTADFYSIFFSGANLFCFLANYLQLNLFDYVRVFLIEEKNSFII